MGWTPVKRERLTLGSYRFLTSSFPRLTTLRWKNAEVDYVDQLFTILPFPPRFALLDLHERLEHPLCIGQRLDLLRIRWGLLVRGN